jgi:hypothetical protein
MSDSPYGGMPAGPTPWMPQGPVPSNGSSRVPVIIAIVIALLALALAAASWFRPTHEATPATPQYSEQQVTDAKKNLCDAYNTMYRALERAGTTTSDDPNQKYMIAMNTRLAFNTAADRLLTEVSQNPAGPPDLVDATRRLAISYQKLVLVRTAEAPQPELDAVYKEINFSETALKTACK